MAVQPPGPTRVRRGLVLGGGGVLGGTWAVGALAALEERLGVAAAEFDIIVGTSAGSVLAALIGAGVTTEQLGRHYRDEPVLDGPLAGYSWDTGRAAGGSRPGLPKSLGPGSVKLIGASVRHPGHLPATAVLSAVVPMGTRSLERIGHLIDAITPLDEWSAHPALWVCAMDFDSGRRVVFGRPGAPAAPLSGAVMASCAIPGWFAPVRIGNRVYVDGGAISATSVDALAYAELDEVYVIAPTVSFQTDQPRAVVPRLERRWREEVTKSCLREAADVAARGGRVSILGPGPADLSAMGANLMDETKRARVLETSFETSPLAWEQAHIVLPQSASQSAAICSSAAR